MAEPRRISWSVVIVGSLLVLSSHPSLAQRPAAANADLEGLAQQLAQLVAEPGFRGFLRSEIAQSKNRENIVELDKFLDRASRRPDAPPGLSQFQQAAKGVSDRLKSDDLEGLDLYIPVDAHRAKWKGGDDVVVAYAPVADEADVREIVAFDVKSGDRVTLDPNREPSRIVLILAPEEHESHEAPKGGPDRDQSSPRPAVTGPNPPEKPVAGAELDASYIGIRRIKIDDVREPWYAGDPEISLFFGQRKGNHCYAHELRGQYYVEPMEDVDDSGVWYSTWTPSRGCPSFGATCWYFENNPFGGSDYYWNRVIVVIWERDSGSDRRIQIYDLYPGVDCEFSLIYAGDDYIDGGRIWETNFDFEYNYPHDMGNAYVVWHKIH